MELTCLGKERKGSKRGPSCHLLQVSGVHFLLECPIDMSMLLHFCPVSTEMEMMMNHNKERRDFSERQENLKRSIFSHEEDEYKNENVKKPKIASSGMHDSMHMDDQLYSKHMKGFRNYDIHKDVCEISADSRIYTKTVDVHSFLEEEPWYMTSEFSLVDVSCIDAVLISNPQGMLGLPFLTGMKGFSGKIYATTVTAKLGQLMMEELVSVHGEYVQSFRRSAVTSKTPFWLKSPIFHTLPKSMQKAFEDDNGVGRLNWHKLYGKLDIEACMKKVQCLHYDEERSIYDCVCIKPCSSGFELGSSNWVITGTRCLSYFSASGLISEHAMGLNVASHVSSDILLFGDLESSTCGEKKLVNEVMESEKVREVSQMIRQENKVSNTFKHCDELSSVCEAALNAVKSGGSVLMANSGFGASLQLLEVISQALCTSKLEHIPIFFVASVAEELLVYTNTVPEWLCTARQEKLYAGEALFGHVELLKTKRLHQISSLHSPESMRLWKEPCIVFAMDWGLRMGASVHLLYKWRTDARCLLVLTQGIEDMELALVPFQPIKMKVLVYIKAQKLRRAEVAAIIEKLKPELSLLPESMKDEFEALSNGKPMISGGNIGLYKNWDVLTIPLPKRIKVNMSADLARDFNPKQLDSGIALGRMMMNLKQKKGSWWLELPERSMIYRSSHSILSSSKENICWGSMRIKDLLNALRERGLHCDETHDDDIGASSTPHEYSIFITSPSHAHVKLMKDSTLIETDDPLVRQLIVDALKNLLNFL